MFKIHDTKLEYPLKDSYLIKNKIQLKLVKNEELRT